MAQADAFIGCWAAKFKYDLVRPITYIRRSIDPKWEPLLNTPPFPEYPSGHSMQSAAAAEVLTSAFGDNFAFEDTTRHGDGLKPRSFASFRAAADEAGHLEALRRHPFPRGDRAWPGAGPLHRRLRDRLAHKEIDHACGVLGSCLDAHWALQPASRPAAAADAVVIPTFVEETASAGIDSTYAGEWEYMVGGGVATFDCNEDGFDDMLLAGGTSPAKFYRNRSTRGGALKFEAETSGLEMDNVTGAYPLDVDSDGVTDLVLLRVGENVVMRGTGRLPFRARQRALELRRRRCLVDGACRNLGTRRRLADAWRSATTSTVVKRFRHGDPAPTTGCTGRAWPRPVLRRQPPLKPSFCALSMLFTDWNRSGTASLRVSNDREYYEGGQEQLWHVDRDQAPALYTDKEGWKVLRIWGMGIASYDLDADGYPEYFLTSMADNKLQTLAAIPEGRLAASDIQGRRLRQGGHRASPLHGRRSGTPARPGTRSSKTSTMTAWWICSLPRAMSRRCRTLR